MKIQKSLHSIQLLIAIHFLCLVIFLLFDSKTAYSSPIVINEIFAQGKGKRPDWIEVYNHGSAPIDLGGYTLTDSRKKPYKWTIPESTILRPHDFLLFFADKKNFENHTNFKLDAGGEFVGLYNPSGNSVDSFTYSSQKNVGSWGRYPDGQAWSFTPTPTMGSSNAQPAKRSEPTLETTSAPAICPKGGNFAKPQSITLQTSSPNTRVYYTTDGSRPSPISRRYTRPLQIDTPTVLRCMAVQEGKRPSEIVTQTFLIGVVPTLPVVSLATDPRNLWDDETGIYVKGSHWKRNNYNENLYNWHQSWKRPCNFEYFDTSAVQQINMPCLMKIFGGVSRNLAQKSFSLNVIDPATDSFNYPFFPQKKHTVFKSLLLRNSGDDWKQTMFRDVLMQALLHDSMDIDIQAWASVIVFLNGSYWGIYNIREKIDPYYITNNYGIDPNRIDMIKCYTDVKAGDLTAYKTLIAFVQSHDLSREKNYKTTAKQIDIDEYINYQLAQIFYDNCDWPGNNIAWWRERDAHGEWRWIVYDTDEGFQFHGSKNLCDRNTVDWATRPHAHASILFNALLKNQKFKNLFLQRFAAYMQTAFSEKRILKTIDKLQTAIRQEMPRHIKRWQVIPSMNQWEANVEELRRFAKERPIYVYEHLNKNFSLQGTVELTLIANDPSKGAVHMDTVPIPSDNPTGHYFKNIPMILHAVPSAGHSFVRWEGLTNSTDQTVSFTPQKAGSMRAVFQ
jgi:hypothetical protein